MELSDPESPIGSHGFRKAPYQDTGRDFVPQQLEDFRRRISGEYSGFEVRFCGLASG